MSAPACCECGWQAMPAFKVLGGAAATLLFVCGNCGVWWPMPLSEYGEMPPKREVDL